MQKQCIESHESKFYDIYSPKCTKEMPVDYNTGSH